MSIFAFEEPHWSVRLERDVAENEGQEAIAQETLVAVLALAGDWWEPLVWELSVACYDTETLHAVPGCVPPRPHWLLRKERIPPGIRADDVLADPMIATTPEMTLERMSGWLREALAQECTNGPRLVPSWVELWSLAARVRLPDSLRVTGHGSLAVDCYAGTVSMPLEHLDGEAWVSGPLDAYVIGAPVELIIRNEDELALAMELRVYWSLWIDDPAGRAQVEAAVDRVLALGRGWRRSTG